MSQKWGVAGLAMTESGALLVFPKNPENGSKLERVVGTTGAMEDIAEMSEVFGGAVEEGDWIGMGHVLHFALMREVSEERGIELSIGQLQLMAEGMEVAQDRGGRGVINFLVACMLVRLSVEQEQFLREKGAVDLESANDLRPRDREAVAIYQRSLGIPVELGIETLV